MSSPVVVIDYGLNNIWSVTSALNHLRIAHFVSSSPVEIEKAKVLILPGIGSFRKAMNSIRELKIDEIIVSKVLGEKSIFLGICLGMQLMGNSGKEDGISKGLGLIDAEVDKFTFEEVNGQKVPHIGFNQVRFNADSKLFHGLPENADFYFVHSYRMLPGNLRGNLATCDYGVQFLAAYENANIFATQFHPEKSQTNGLKLLAASAKSR